MGMDDVFLLTFFVSVGAFIYFFKKSKRNRRIAVGVAIVALFGFDATYEEPPETATAASTTEVTESVANSKISKTTTESSSEPAKVSEEKETQVTKKSKKERKEQEEQKERAAEKEQTEKGGKEKEKKKAEAAKKEQDKKEEKQREKEAAEKKQAEKERKTKEEKQKKEVAEKKKKEQKSKSSAAAKKSNKDLADLDYDGVQTIDVNDNEPTFSKNDLSLANKAWEKYGDLDKLNRATSAEAMLNQSTMPEGDEERGDISNVEPTGWKNKKIKSGYLYNRSHLIGWALSAENDNWKNLITGTRQLNSPEMQRFEMDVKYYLEQSKDNYVRYSVTPIFRGDEELARGVHMMAQSVGDDEISFNKYVFNVQDGVTLDYSDGTSQVDENMQVAEDQEKAKQEAEENNEQPEEQPVQEEPSGEQYVDENGNGLIKGSKSKIYHVPGSQYYDQTTNPERTFKSIEEAEDAGYRAPK
ncbi:hypothetical protein TK11N_24610 [Tetragenococcus koreensis]|uniref:Type VII secretion system protein EssD-like domain-containing protein n=1 Tax=Tetragenococcus koreensis TaxID=290335 RepID=A0AAN4UE29_9ENTE|nr:hypothetical protein TK11N_24610 [Tetragenococcus koreensis]GEQ53118.1 hypothetical protein TK12N_24620 [Tetragenococcus koreensis]GEQ55621.1 hypothetical protein TK2N_24650 [Tetragenococcus koreensis]GEQ58118.1 hypothetical protein TK4N_24610 [Tetragenococcus koreensis]GEQ60621.1 hypothetical protein TK6N_24600 [Tetragenococcus koreensis]